MSIFSCVRSPVRGADVDAEILPPTATENLYPITATSGSSVSADTTPSTGNAVAVPAAYSELMVYVGELSIAKEKAVLYVKVGSASPQAVEVLSYGCVAIKAVAGQTVAFGAATMNRDSNTLTNGVLSLTVIPHRGKAQAAPSGVTGTINLDRCSPNLYVPSRSCIVFQDEYQRFSIAPSSRKRDIFIMEADGGANVTPIRHVHIPENQTIKVDCRYQFVCIFSIDTATLDVTCPTGAVLATDAGVVWEPPFTASKTISVSTVAEFKTAMNDASDNVDVVMAPGTYDLQAGGTGNRMNNTNFSTAVTKNRRIRSSTGNQNDVLFKVATPAIAGMQWDVTLSSGKAWILQDISYDIAGAILTSAATGLLNFTGPVHTCRVKVTGAAAGSSDTSFKILAASGTGSFNCYSAWCTFSGASKDLTASNGDGTKTYIPTLHQIGNYLDGNGSASNDQVVTNHNNGIQINWGCTYGNLTTGNLTRVASDAAPGSEGSICYLMYCRSYVENYVTTIGIDVPGNGAANASYLHFCDFQAFQTADAMKSAVCCTMKTYRTGRPMAYVANSITQGKWTGCDIVGPSGGTGDIILDALDSAVSLVGCRLTHQNSGAGSGMLRMFKNVGTGPWTGTITHCLFRVISGSAPFFSIATANEVLAITNTLFVTGGPGIYTISGSATGTSTITGSFLQKPTAVATAPTNWDARFSGSTWASLGTNQRSISGPDIDANDVPTSGGTLQGDGVSSIVGSTDIYGRPFLGGEWSPGAAQLTTVVSGQFLYPLVWI